ncbi:GNAT family N-acetyltransferase [Roseomonas hellenica]|uniref:GNAT family N-acetyltransferase n=1 Tax=Plastoroseomonas hellenica TaxID=2687306 RepID=A0ABS5F8J5_9PROT|nr:GNAT family N-acetyltransferase [Plastoroseomonas hellenica]MBR0668883.1 GNAT family N-acetyltransferase [Plastoroseomonas hellenica]
MSSTVQIRPIVPADAPAIARLMQGLGFDHSAAEIGRRLAMAPDRASDPALVAEAEGRAAGLIALHIAPMLFYPKPIARITTLVVDVATRRHGIGRALVEATVALAEEAGCDTLELTTALHREEAQAFYRALGFDCTSFRMALRLQGITAAR